MSTRPHLPVAAAAAIALLAAPLAAQCGTTATGLTPLQGVDGAVHATAMWDPDGAGPAAPVLVAGGWFTVAGDAMANGVAAFDFATQRWTRLGNGVRPVYSLAALPTGELLAGGIGVSRWDGTTWTLLGTGFDGPVYALAVRPNGDIVAGGAFVSIGTLQVGGLARWNGSAWSAMGTGVNQAVQALAAMPNGDVVAAGNFGWIDGQQIQRIARWNGATWSPLGAGISGEVHALALLGNGDLIAGGSFGSAGTVVAANVARWDGAAWSAVGSGITGAPEAHVRALAALGGAAFAATGEFGFGGGFAGGIAVGNVAIWTGAAWQAVGAGVSTPPSAAFTSNTVVATPSGLVVGGRFQRAGTARVGNVAMWNGAEWSSVGAGIDDNGFAVAELPDGDVVLGGWFGRVGGVDARYIARWNGSAWHPLGTGLDGSVSQLMVAANGALYAMGGFTTAGGVAAPRLARWQGGQWSAVAPAANTAGGACVAELPNGDLAVGGSIAPNGSTGFVARWNGTTWTQHATNGAVYGLALCANGDLVATGTFTSIDNVAASRIARFDGTAWHPLGGGLNGIGTRVVALRGGGVVALGTFTQAGGLAANRVAAWDGVAWRSWAGGVGGDSASTALELPDGDVLVGGTFTTAGGVPAGNLARWNGSAWSAVADANARVHHLALGASGDVLAAGWFTTMGGAATPYVARLRPTCAATATSLGGGCASSGGANTLAATALPWVGATFRARASGVPQSSFVAAVWGFAGASLPLAALLPQGVPGCSLLASPDLVDVVLPVAGVAASALAIPDVPALVGLSLRHQMVPFEVAANGAFLAITSTNVLQLTIGLW